MGAGMDRKALDESLKALQAEMDSISKNRKMASRQAAQLRRQLDMEFNLDDKEEFPPWQWKMGKYDLHRVEEEKSLTGLPKPMPLHSIISPEFKKH